MKIWCFELHLALVSCQYPDFSRNGSHLKKSVRKVEFLHCAKLVNFQHFQLFEKNAWLWEAVLSKPLNPQETKGYQWKDNVHIFHLIPSGTLCDHWSGHRDALKTGPILYKNFFLQRVDGFPYVEASMVLIAKRTNSVTGWPEQLSRSLSHENYTFCPKKILLVTSRHPRSLGFQPCIPIFHIHLCTVGHQNFQD